MVAKMYDVGKIVNTHGVRGEVRVIRITDFDERFTVGETLYLVMNEEQPRPLKIVGHRKHKQFDLVLFEDYTNINEVEPFKGGMLKVHEADLTELSENEYYHHEIVGCAVYTEKNEKLGTIKEILSPGANDVWVVEQLKGKDILLPLDRKSTRLNSSHVAISYAVFCLKKK